MLSLWVDHTHQLCSHYQLLEMQDYWWWEQPLLGGGLPLTTFRWYQCTSADSCPLSGQADLHGWRWGLFITVDAVWHRNRQTPMCTLFWWMLKPPSSPCLQVLSAKDPDPDADCWTPRMWIGLFRMLFWNLTVIRTCFFRLTAQPMLCYRKVSIFGPG